MNSFSQQKTNNKPYFTNGKNNGFFSLKYRSTWVTVL